MPQQQTKSEFKVKRNRQKLHGVKISEIELIQKTVNYYLGDKAKRLEPMPITTIATTMGRHRDTIYEYLNKAVEIGLLKKDETSGRFVKPEKSQQEEF